MEDKNKDLIPPEDNFLMDEPPLFEEPVTDMPQQRQMLQPNFRKSQNPRSLQQWRLWKN